MIGLEGSGFVISVGISLLLCGMIVFFIRQKFVEYDNKFTNILGVLQMLQSKNSNDFTGASLGGNVGGAGGNFTMGGLAKIEEEKQSELINVSDDSEQDESDDDESEDDASDDDASDDDASEDGNDDNGAIENEEGLNVENLNSNLEEVDILNNEVKVVDLNSGADPLEALITHDNNETSDSSNDELEHASEPETLESLKEKILEVNEIDDNNLENYTKENLNKLNVKKLRDLVKDKNLSTSVSKLTKTSCIELLLSN